MITFVQRLPAIRFSYQRRADVTLTNTGAPDEEATVRADVPGGSSITLNETRYGLLQFHWHTPSEHEIGGRSSPMEMHLVHSAADGSTLVIGVFIEQGRPNRTLAPIFEQLPEATDETRRVAGVRIDKLLPRDRASFRYTGSLTTPPFTEGVQWIVLAQPITLSKRQIAAFRGGKQPRGTAAQRPRGAKRRPASRPARATVSEAVTQQRAVARSRQSSCHPNAAGHHGARQRPVPVPLAAAATHLTGSGEDRLRDNDAIARNRGDALASVAPAAIHAAAAGLSMGA